MAGCKPGTPKKTVRFGYTEADQLHSPAVMVMKEKRLLEAAGFSVKWEEFPTGTYAVREMASGSLDFSSCGFVPVMIARSQGAPVIILAGPNKEGSGLVVHSAIRTIEELDDKRIGTPGHDSIQDVMMARLARENHLLIHRMTMDVSDMPFFLQRNEIDGFIAWAPHPAKAVEQKIGQPLLTSRDIMPNHQCCVLVTGERIMQDDPETVSKVLEVYIDAYKWFLENRDESVKLMAKYTGTNEAVILQTLDTVSYSFPPYCNTESMQDMAVNLIETGRITTGEADPAAFIEELYRPELLEKISDTK